ncbi:MAG: hypothetical protein AAGI30_05215 [Planctomycetota bacterium]
MTTIGAFVIAQTDTTVSAGQSGDGSVPILGLLLALIVWNLAVLTLGILVIHQLGAWFGDRGKAVLTWLERAPGLDLAITYFTALPLFGGFLIAHAITGSLIVSVLGFLAGGLSIALAVVGWTIWHERQHKDALQGPRIVSTLNPKVGRIRNHAAVWWTALCVPIFWIIRAAEYIVYPPLTWLVKLPSYTHSEWVNVSRHKFDGLVGHDLIWCLYCDWMTGIWSLGGEMLRNVESFWCPIRFRSDKKCANCSVDFPDVNGSWVPADGTMGDVTALLDEQYTGGVNAWHGHPMRLTVEGEPVDATDTSTPPGNTDAESEQREDSGT